MHPVLEDLITLLRLERIEDNIFRGESRDIGGAQVFGGQVLGQALSAAQHTVDARVAHSLHGGSLVMTWTITSGQPCSPIRGVMTGSSSMRNIVWVFRSGSPAMEGN